MKKVFVHRYKWGHTDRRRVYKRKLKEGKVILLEENKDGWLYRVVDKELQSIVKQHRTLENPGI